MLTSHILATNTRLKSDVLKAAVEALDDQGWKPALLESTRAFLALAGVNLDEAPLVRVRSRYTRGETEGEVFFRDDGIYFVFNLGSESDVLDYMGGPLLTSVLVERAREEFHPRVIVGLITADNDRPTERLYSFACLVETAVRDVLASSDVTSLSIDWKPETSSGKLERLDITEDSETGPSFVPARLVPEEAVAAHILADESPRRAIIAISKAGFVREQDMLGRRTTKREDLVEAISKLKDAGLIETQYLLECRKTGSGLTRVTDLAQLEVPEIAAFTCPSCGLPFNEENVSEGYLLSELGLRMSQQSQWMTVWVTELLVKLGVDLSSIRWNIAEHGEEVDMLVEHANQLWMFELKDREFGAGDAHPLNYRRSLYDADKGIIVSTERVSQDAKRVLQEVTTESRRSSRGAVPRHRYVYIEGLNSAEEILQQQMSSAALVAASRRLRVLTEISGFDFSTILRARFGLPSASAVRRAEQELDV